MEQDAEVKNGEALSYTTEFRQYDPRVGRWLSPDPVVKSWESPYASFANNPIYFVDPSGLTPTGGGDPEERGHGKLKRASKKLNSAGDGVPSNEQTSTGGNKKPAGSGKEKMSTDPIVGKKVDRIKGATGSKTVQINPAELSPQDATSNNSYYPSWDQHEYMAAANCSNMMWKRQQAASDAASLDHLRGDYGYLVGTARHWGNKGDQLYKDQPPLLLDGLLSLNPLYDVARGAHSVQNGDYVDAGVRFGGAVIGLGGVFFRGSKLFVGDSHVYHIVDNATGEIYKYGISSVPLLRNGKSLRMEVQVRRLNFGLGVERYTGTVSPSIFNTRAGALEAEHYLTTLYKYNNTFKPGFIPRGMKRPLGNQW